MTFFYDLNKRLATLASKQDQQHIAESAKVEAVAKSPFTQALNESKRPDANKNGIPDYAEDGIGKMEEAGYSAKKAAAGKDIGKPGKNFAKIAKSAGKEYGSKEAGERVAGAVLNKLRHPKEGIENEGNAFSGAVVKSKADGIQKGEKIKVGAKTYPVKEADVVGLGEEEKMAEGVSRKHFQAIADTLRHIEDMEKRKELAQHHASAFKLANPRFDQKRFFQAAGIDEGNAFTGKLNSTPKGSKFKLGNKEFKDTSSIEEQEMDEGYAEMDAWLKSREKEKGTGKFDSRKTSTGTVYTRKPETFDDPETDPEATGGAPKRKGRPAGTRRAIGAKGPGVKSKLLQKGAIAEEHGKVCEYCGHSMNEESTDKEDTKAEKAGKRVAKDIEHDEGHKGKDDNRAEKAGKKVTKDIEYDDKKDRKEKKADKEEKVDETSDAPKASKGMQFGKGVYESLDTKLENMISEGMNVSVNMNSDAEGDAQKSITVTATGADADKLADLLKMAGLEQKEETCPACGSSDCECDSELEENSPDWPTDKETLEAEPNLRTYSGGLNGPKSTGQTTIPVIAGQARRQTSMEENVELERSLFKTWKNYKG